MVATRPILRVRAPRGAAAGVPLAAAAAVIALIAGTAAVSSAIHGRRAAAGASPAHRVIAYVANAGSGTVTPIRTATNTALPPIKAGRAPYTIAITPDGKTAYVPNPGSGGVTPIRAATNTPLPPIKTGPPPRRHRDHPVAAPPASRPDPST